MNESESCQDDSSDVDSRAKYQIGRAKASCSENKQQCLLSLGEAEPKAFRSSFVYPFHKDVAESGF